MKRSETQRFINVFNELKKSGEVKGTSDFAEKICYPQSSTSLILNNKRDAPITLLNKICEVFGVERQYIFEGKEPIFSPEKKLTPQNNNMEAALRKEVETLREKLEMAREIIKSKDQTIAALTGGEIGKQRAS
jgi:hypothetical protein